VAARVLVAGLAEVAAGVPVVIPVHPRGRASLRRAGLGDVRGIRVVDLSRLVAGNMLSLQLGDFGADVIKVEPPQGDPLREWREDGHSLFWKVYGRNKRSIVLNLREAADMEALRALIAGADVFIENYRPGTLEEMGLGPDVLHKASPGLIVVRVSGFGQTGPYAALPGFGTLVEAMSGFAARTGFPDREPVLPPLALADMIAGLYGAFATVTALRARDNGFSTRLAPEVEVTHLGGDSRSDPRLWALLAVNKLALYRKRHGVVRGALFRAITILRELRFAAAGNRPSRRAARALLSPSEPRR